MPKTKKPTTKPAKPTKISDVASPDSSPTDPTSVPVILKNRPILQDPMMAEDKLPEPEVKDVKPKKKPVKGAPLIKKIELQPLAPVTPIIADAAAEPTPSPETDEVDSEEPAAADEAPQKIEVKTKPKPAHEAEPAVQTETAAPQAPADEEPAEKPAEEPPTPSTSTAAPPQKTEAPKPAESVAPADDELLSTDDKSADSAAAKAARQMAERQLALEKLIGEGTYVLPINAVEKRRLRRTIIALLLLLILAGAGLLASLDAGYVHIDGFSAPTDFIKDHSAKVSF